VSFAQHREANFLPEPATRRLNNNSRVQTTGQRSAQSRAQAILDCARAVERLGDYLAGSLRAADRKAFEAHQRACPDCVAFLRTYRKTVALTRAFLRLRPAPRRLELRR